MKMAGHQTESVYRRYVIADEELFLDSAKKLAKPRQGARTCQRQGDDMGLAWHKAARRGGVTHWFPMPEAGLEPAREIPAQDFKSCVSANSTTPAWLCTESYPESRRTDKAAAHHLGLAFDTSRAEH